MNLAILAIGLSLFAIYIQIFATRIITLEIRALADGKYDKYHGIETIDTTIGSVIMFIIFYSLGLFRSLECAAIYFPTFMIVCGIIAIAKDR